MAGLQEILGATSRQVKELSLLLLAGVSVALTSCGAGASPPRVRGAAGHPQTTSVTLGASGHTTSPTGSSAARASLAGAPLTALAKPAALSSFRARPERGEGVWRAVGRRVEGTPAVYETTLAAPGGSQRAGIAWMDTSLLAARLYSGSESPGGGPYRYTAPIERAAARNLVAAFNGGFLMDAAKGGYFTEGRMIDPLRRGAASLVIDVNGSVDVGAWGTEIRMGPEVAAVRQNLVPLVDGGRPAPLAQSAGWRAWGATCAAHSCAASVPGIEHQWRSALGVVSDGALVYVQGPALDPLQLARLLVRAGVRRGMELDINPDWPVFATYAPASERGLAAPSNGQPLLSDTVRGAGTFFEAWWARDFITLSSRHAPAR